MSIWGKIVGGAAGFAMGGPLGGIFGLVAGHAYDKYRDSQQEDEGNDPTKSIGFTIGVIVLSAKMAKADGIVTRDEIDAFKKVFRVPDNETKNVAKVFDQARKDSQGFEPYARQLAKMFTGNAAVLEEILSCLTEIAKADGHVHPNELKILNEISDIFGLDHSAFERVTELRKDLSDADPYQILGVARSISDDDLKSAYRALVRENHPDKLVAQGMPEEFVEIANKKLAAINAAYEKVQAERGLR